MAADLKKRRARGHQMANDSKRREIGRRCGGERVLRIEAEKKSFEEWIPKRERRARNARDAHGPNSFI